MTAEDAAKEGASDEVEDLEPTEGDAADVAGGGMVKSVEISNLKAGDSNAT